MQLHPLCPEEKRHAFVPSVQLKGKKANALFAVRNFVQRYDESLIGDD